MPVHARRCEGCGGPLPEAPADATTITCSFCSMVNEVASTVTTAAPIVITLDTHGAAARVGRAVALAVLAVVTIMIIGVGVFVYRTLHPVSDALNASALRMREATRTLSLGELSKLTERGYRQVQASEPPGGWTAFDPVAGIPWVSEVS